MIMNNYNLGDIFQDDEEYSARAEYANINGYIIKEIDSLNGIRQFQITANPKPTFEELKQAKLLELSNMSAKYQSWNCHEMYITSSLGVQVNSDHCSQNNIAVLIKMLPDDDKTTSFKLFDNSFKDLNRVELQTLLAECKKNGLALYQQKFALQTKIEACTTKDELETIDINFVFADYSTEG